MICLAVFLLRVAAVQASSTGTYEYIVAGAGSAGATLAAKLAKGGKSVLLLEAGPEDTWKGQDVAGNFVDNYKPTYKMTQDVKFAPEVVDVVMSEPVWQVARIRDPRLAKVANVSDFGSRYKEIVPRARIVGGCSMINSMYWFRGSPTVYESWGQNWTWEVLFPKFKAMETTVEPDVDPAYHGYSGGCMVSSMWNVLTEAEKAFIIAATKGGHPFNKDFNGASMLGMGATPMSLVWGDRWSSARAFLTPEVRSLPNFHLITDAMVERVIFDGTTARGVNYRTQDGVLHTAAASKEVILCLGAFKSPQILMLSGVGPPAMLQDFGIPLVAASSGVGRNLQDHLCVAATSTTSSEAQKSNETNFNNGGFFFSPACKRRNCSHPDMQLMCSHDSTVNMHFCLACLTGYIESNRGFMLLKSRDPKEYAAIYPNYLHAPNDVDRLVDAVEEVCRIYAIDPNMFQPFESPLLPGGWICDQKKTRQDRAEYVRSFASTIHHASGTCKMGPSSDKMAVVGPTLKVHGVKGLRVADASIMPTIPNSNTDAPSRMIGFHVADMILEEDTEGKTENVYIL